MTGSDIVLSSEVVSMEKKLVDDSHFDIYHCDIYIAEFGGLKPRVRHGEARQGILRGLDLSPSSDIFPCPFLPRWSKIVTYSFCVIQIGLPKETVGVQIDSFHMFAM